MFKQEGHHFFLAITCRPCERSREDKVSRFETEMELGRQTHFMTTLIIVDRIGEGSRISDMATEIGGNIVQMSMSFWVEEVAQILNDNTGFNHEILKMTDKDSLKFIRDSVAGVELRNFK